MNYTEITLEDMKNAKTYMPIMEKEQFIHDVVTGCFEQLNVQAAFNEGNTEQFPNMYKENTTIKARFLMGALLMYYFGFDIVPVEGSDWLVSADDYDRYAGGRIFETLQRFKSNADVRDKAYDILADYKDLESKLNREISGLMNAMNDPVSRAFMVLRQPVAPEQLTTMMSDLNSSAEMIQNYIKEHKVEDTADEPETEQTDD